MIFHLHVFVATHRLCQPVALLQVIIDFPIGDVHVWSGAMREDFPEKDSKRPLCQRMTRETETVKAKLMIFLS